MPAVVDHPSRDAREEHLLGPAQVAARLAHAREVVVALAIGARVGVVHVHPGLAAAELGVEAHLGEPHLAVVGADAEALERGGQLGPVLDDAHAGLACAPRHALPLGPEDAPVGRELHRDREGQAREHGLGLELEVVAEVDRHGRMDREQRGGGEHREAKGEERAHRAAAALDALEGLLE